MTLLITLLCSFMLQAPAFATGFTARKPTISAASGYVNGRISLKWSKVTGAARYEIWRSKSKGSGYKKFATTTRASYSKKTTGDYYYKVRGVKGSQKSKFSSPVYGFAANGRITNVGFSDIYGISFRVLISNKSKKAMSMLGTNLGTLYLVNKGTGSVVDSCRNVILSTQGGIGKQINAGATKSVYFYAYAPSAWLKYDAAPNRYKWLLTVPFYAGGSTASSKSMAIAMGGTAAESSVAVRK